MRLLMGEEVSTMEEMICPKCGSSGTQKSKKICAWICEDCGKTLKRIRSGTLASLLMNSGIILQYRSCPFLCLFHISLYKLIRGIGKSIFCDILDQLSTWENVHRFSAEINSWTEFMETSAKEVWYFISTYFGRQYISDIASALLTIAIGHFQNRKRVEVNVCSSCSFLILERN